VDARFTDLAGAQVLRLGGHPVEDVLRALDLVVARDNDMGLKWLAPEFLRMPKVLNGLGLIPDDKSLPLTVRDAGGKERDVTLPADAGEPAPSWVSARKDAGLAEPLYLYLRQVSYWFEYLPAEQLVWFQYNEVGNQGQETLEQFTARLFRFINKNSVAMDYRTWIAPQIYAPPTFAAYRANRDPALEAILAHLGAEGNRASERQEPAYAISTVAGTGEPGFGGDGGPAVAAKLNRPCAVAVDREGNLYIADYMNHRVRKVGRDGTITTLAGTGEPGSAGDGGPAAKAQLQGPYGVSVDRHGNVYVADQRNNRVRKVAPDGTLSTVAGNGKRAFAGDGGPAAAASLSGPNATVSDEEGNLYIADSGNHRVRKVAPDGTITTVAGTEKGYTGDGGQAVQAKLNLPAALALDPKGNLYVGDFHNHVVRKIAPDGVITTVAGTGERGASADGTPATQAKLNEPGGLGIARDGSLLIADGVNFRIRRVGPDGVLQTVAGTGRRGYSGDGGPATQADLSVLDILAVDGQGNVYVADHGNNRIRKLTPAGSPRPGEKK
jgi:sugar lactone lactonase YvrE